MVQQGYRSVEEEDRAREEVLSKFFFTTLHASSLLSPFHLRYYSSLPRELILRFYSKFRMDFELFDYSINEILKKAGYDPIHEDNAL